MQSNHSDYDDASLDPAQGADTGPESIEQDPAQMPLNLATGGGDEAIPGLEEHSTFGQNKGINGFLLILLLLIIGGGTLWVMRMSGAMESSDPDLASAEKKINQALQRFGQNGEGNRPLKELFSETNEAISVFANDPVKSQINLGNVKKNPFELTGGEKNSKTVSNSGPTAEEQRRRERAMRLQELRRKAEQLELQSLLSGGEKSMAVISGEVVGEGDNVGPFTVSAISPYGVRLKAEGNTYTIRINPSKKNNNKSRRFRR